MSSARWPRREERCAPQANHRGDPMLGTAFPAARLLLVEQPLPWGREGLRDSGLDRAVARVLQARGQQEGVRVQAIRRLGRDPAPGRRRWAIADTRGPAPSLRWGTFSDDAELLKVPLDGSAGVADREPAYLVCTHGRHDPCCAERGRPMIVALAALRPGQVWQTAHLGGCRFAPSVLVLPTGLVYGRLSPADGPALIAATEAGEVLTGRLRGRVGIPAVAQAAIGFAHERLGLRRSDELSLVSTRALDGDRVCVRLATPTGHVEVVIECERIHADGLTCGSRGASWFVAHRLVSIQTVIGDDDEGAT